MRHLRVSTLGAVDWRLLTPQLKTHQRLEQWASQSSGRVRAATAGSMQVAAEGTEGAATAGSMHTKLQPRLMVELPCAYLQMLPKSSFLVSMLWGTLVLSAERTWGGQAWEGRHGRASMGGVGWVGERGQVSCWPWIKRDGRGGGYGWPRRWVWCERWRTSTYEIPPDPSLSSTAKASSAMWPNPMSYAIFLNSSAPIEPLCAMEGSTNRGAVRGRAGAEGR